MAGGGERSGEELLAGVAEISGSSEDLGGLGVGQVREGLIVAVLAQIEGLGEAPMKGRIDLAWLDQVLAESRDEPFVRTAADIPVQQGGRSRVEHGVVGPGDRRGGPVSREQGLGFGDAVLGPV